MPDNTLQFETRVDLSGLNSGMDAAKAKIQDFSDSATTAVNSVQAATKNLTDAQIQLGASAEAGNEQAIAIIQEYQDQLDATTKSTAQLRIEQKRQYEEYVQAAKQAANQVAQAAKQSASEEKAVQQELTIAQRRQYEEYISQSSAEAAVANQSAAEKKAAELEAASVAQIAQKRQYEEYILQQRLEVAAAKESAIQKAAADKSAAQAAAQAAREAAAEQSIASQETSIAQKRQYEEYIAEQRAIMEADKSVLSSRMAIGAEARILEGSTQGSTRALAAWLSSIPALATAAQAAFTGFALVAIGEIAFDVGKKLYDAFDLGGQRARKFQQDLVDVQAQFEETQANLDVKLQKLIAERSHLEKKAATNGLALDLAEATQRALELDKVLESINKDREGALKDNAPSIPQRLLGTTGTRDESVMLEEHTRRMKESTTAEAQLNEQKSYGAALQQKLTDLNSAQDVANQLAAGGGMVVSYQKQIDAIKQLVQWKEQDQKVIETTQKVDTVQSDVNKLHGDKVPKGPQINRIQLLIEEQNKETQLYAQFHEHIQAMWMEDYRAQMEAYSKGEQADRERTELFKKNRAEEANAAREVADETHNVNLGGIETAQTASTNKNALSLVQDPQGQLQALRNFHQQADAENERYYAEEIKIATGADELQRVTQLENKLGEVRRAANIRQLNDEKNIQQQVALVEQQALLKIQNDIATTFAKSITTQESWAQASIKLYQQVADQFITNLVKMGEQELIALALHKSVASQKIITDAKTAAADSFQWASAWGGPIAGAVAAAAAFAGVLAFDSFEHGGVVNGPSGSPVPIMAHAGERVLTAGQTNKFESLVNNGGSSSSNVNLHYNPQINGIDKSGMRSILQSHADDIHAIVRSGVRSGAIGARG